MRPRRIHDVFALQASMLRTLASPLRLQILDRLGHGPAGVDELAAALGASQPNTSAHLASLRGAGLVEAVRDGRRVRYEVTDPEIIRACGLVQEVLARRLAHLGAMATAARRVGGAALGEPVAAVPRPAARERRRRSTAIDPNGPSTSGGRMLPPTGS